MTKDENNELIREAKTCFVAWFVFLCILICFLITLARENTIGQNQGLNFELQGLFIRPVVQLSQRFFLDKSMHLISGDLLIHVITPS